MYGWSYLPNIHPSGVDLRHRNFVSLVDEILCGIQVPYPTVLTGTWRSEGAPFAVELTELAFAFPHTCGCTNW